MTNTPKCEKELKIENNTNIGKRKRQKISRIDNLFDPTKGYMTEIRHKYKHQALADL